MLGTAQARLDADKQWLSDTRTALDKSETDLNSAFDRLRTRLTAYATAWRSREHLDVLISDQCRSLLAHVDWTTT